jgi:hypothetical protein
MRQLVDVLVGLAVSVPLVTVGVSLLFAQPGFRPFSEVCPLPCSFAGGDGFDGHCLRARAAADSRQMNREPEGVRIQQGVRTWPKAGPGSELVPMPVFILTPDS